MNAKGWKRRIATEWLVFFAILSLSGCESKLKRAERELGECRSRASRLEDDLILTNRALNQSKSDLDVLERCIRNVGGECKEECD